MSAGSSTGIHLLSTHASLQLQNFWKAKGLFHRQTSGLLV